MIRVICNQETFVYNAYHMVKAFYPSETVMSSVDEKASNYVTVEFAEEINQKLLDWETEDAERILVSSSIDIWNLI